MLMTEKEHREFAEDIGRGIRLMRSLEWRLVAA